MIRTLAALALVLAGCSPSTSDRIAAQCHEARADEERFCSSECRTAYLMAERSCMAPMVPPSLYACINARPRATLCGGVTFNDCDVLADCAAEQSAEVQQLLFESEGCFRAAVAPYCE